MHPCALNANTAFGLYDINAVEGDYNPAGLLGKPTDDRVGFSQIRISAVIDADLTDEQKAQFLDEVCQRCPLHDNLSHTSEVVHSLA